MRIDADQPRRFTQRVENPRDFGAAERARAVVILATDDGATQRAFGGGMPRSGLCRVGSNVSRSGRDYRGCQMTDRHNPTSSLRFGSCAEEGETDDDIWLHGHRSRVT
jgi:hypothetical protein